MKKFLLLLIVAGVAAYGYWPYHAAKKLETALRAADKDALDQIIDFPAVRQSLKDQFKAKVSAEAAAISAQVGANADRAKTVPAFLAGAVADKVIDSMVTSESIARALKLESAVGGGSSMVLRDKHWRGPTEFSARAQDDSRFTFRLVGIAGWRVVSVEPGAKLGKQAQIPR